QRDGDQRDDREDGGGRRGAAVPADDEQRDDEQVEGHLVGQRPQDVHRVGDVEQVLQHGGVREDGGGGGVLLESGPEPEDAQQVGEHRQQGRHRQQRVDPEEPSDPEVPDAAAPLQRRRDD